MPSTTPWASACPMHRSRPSACWQPWQTAVNVWPRFAEPGRRLEHANCKLKIGHCKLKIAKIGGQPSSNLQFLIVNFQFAIPQTKNRTLRERHEKLHLLPPDFARASCRPPGESL